MITARDLGAGEATERAPGRQRFPPEDAHLRNSAPSPRVASMSPSRGKPWGGRFRQATDPAVERFTASIHFDAALARHDLQASMAHVRMLHKQGLVSAG